MVEIVGWHPFHEKYQKSSFCISGLFQKPLNWKVLNLFIEDKLKYLKANYKKQNSNEIILTTAKELSKEKPVEIILYGPISVQELAEKMCISGTEIIRILLF